MINSIKKINFFRVLNICFLILTALICIIPLIHVAAVSFSSNAAAAAGAVALWPKEFTLNSYKYVARRPALWRAMFVSVKRVLLGAGINMLLTILSA